MIAMRVIRTFHSARDGNEMLADRRCGSVQTDIGVLRRR